MNSEAGPADGRFPVAAHGELGAGDRRIVNAGGISIGVFMVNGVYHAYRNVCPHAGAPVCLGKIGGTTLASPIYEYHYGRDDQILRCPWHGWEFDLTTGAHLVDPSMTLRSYPVEVVDGVVYVLTKPTTPARPAPLS